MDYVQWTPFFSVSVPELDEDHRELFRIINEFFHTYETGHGGDQVFQVLNRLVIYAEHHFAREEKLLLSTHYPDALRHRLEHEHLLQEVFRIHGAWAHGTAEIDSEVLDFLETWLQRHIVEFDKAYQSHVCEALAVD